MEVVSSNQSLAIQSFLSDFLQKDAEETLEEADDETLNEVIEVLAEHLDTLKQWYGSDAMQSELE